MGNSRYQFIVCDGLVKEFLILESSTVFLQTYMLFVANRNIRVTCWKYVPSGLGQFLATESKNNEKYYFTLKALFVLKMFRYFSWLFCHVEKDLN